MVEIEAHGLERLQVGERVQRLGLVVPQKDLPPLPFDHYTVYRDHETKPEESSTKNGYTQTPDAHKQYLGCPVCRRRANNRRTPLARRCRPTR